MADASDTTGSSSQLIASVKSANGGCKPAAVQPAIKTKNGVVKLITGADSDFVIERAGKPAISFVGLTDDMAEVKDAVDVKLKQSIVDINENSARKFQALEDKLDQKTEGLQSNVAASLKSVDAKLAAFDQKVTSSLDAVDSQLNDASAKAAASTAANKATVDTKLAASATARVAALAALEAKLMKSIKDLGDKSACSHNGVLQSDGKCKCTAKGAYGDRCETIEIPQFCTGKSAGLHADGGNKRFCYGKDGLNWEMVYNLATSRKPTLEYREGFWTESKRNLGTLGFKEDCKGAAFYDKKGYTQVMVVAHDKGNSFYGHAIYDVRSDMRLKTMLVTNTSDNFKRYIYDPSRGCSRMRIGCSSERPTAALWHPCLFPHDIVIVACLSGLTCVPY